MLPAWTQIIIGIAAIVIASGVIYTKLIRPMVQLIELLTAIRKDLGEQPKVFAVLSEIAKQFRTNAGSSLRDVVDRLDAAAIENRIAIEANRLTLESAKVLAEADRRAAARLEVILNLVSAKADIAAGASEAAAALAAGVAVDLEDAHVRAEERDSTTAAPGEAADAAMRRPTQ